MAKKAIKTGNLERLQIEYVPIDSIRANEYNPNRQSEHEFELLLRSIREDGQTQPVIVGMDDVIVDGEHRWRAMKTLGYAEVGIVHVDMDDARRRIATIRHNLARGSHDIQLEAQVLRDLEKLGALATAQEALQLEDIEVERLLKDISPLDEYGSGEAFHESWDYSPGKLEDEEHSTASTAVKDVLTATLKREQAEMQASDATLVKRNFTLTREQSLRVNTSLGEQAADTLVAMAEAHSGAKRTSGKEWTTLTFVVPSSALPNIQAELARLEALAPNMQPGLTPELRRGLALEFMAELSSQTPGESLR